MAGQSPVGVFVCVCDCDTAHCYIKTEQTSKLRGVCGGSETTLTIAIFTQCDSTLVLWLSSSLFNFHIGYGGRGAPAYRHMTIYVDDDDDDGGCRSLLASVRVCGVCLGECVTRVAGRVCRFEKCVGRVCLCLLRLTMLRSRKLRAKPNQSLACIYLEALEESSSSLLCAAGSGVNRRAKVAARGDEGATYVRTRKT